MERLIPPFRGVANSTGFIDTPPGFVPFSLDEDGLPRARNFLPHTPGSKDRGQMGQRHGFSKVFDVQMGAGLAVQAMTNVARASVVTGFTQTDAQTMTNGLSLESVALSVTNYAQLDSVPSADGFGFLDDGVSHANFVQVAATCPVMHTDGYQFAFIASNYTGTDGFSRSTIRCFRTDTGATVWTYTISTAITNRFINTMTCSDNFLFVCTNAVVLMLRVADGSLVATETLNADAQESIESCVFKDADGDEWLFVLFAGSEVAGATVAGVTIEAGNPASHFRAGVTRLLIGNEYVSTTGPYAGLPLTGSSTGWGQVLVPATGAADNVASRFYERFHGYFRFSERSRVVGHGCLPTAIHCDPRTGTLVIARTNQGYGPNSGLDTVGTGASGLTFAPDGTIFEPVSVCAISFDGELLWETDIGSIFEIGLGGFYNDIPTGADDDPSLSAVRCNRLGTACVAGRQNIIGYSVFLLDIVDGTILNKNNVMATTGSVRQACMGVDPGDQNFVIGGDRNDDWEGSSSTNAHLWKVHAVTAEIVWYFDLGAAVSSLGLGMLAMGGIVYGFDYVA